MVYFFIKEEDLVSSSFFALLNGKLNKIILDFNKVKVYNENTKRKEA